MEQIQLQLQHLSGLIEGLVQQNQQQFQQVNDNIAALNLRVGNLEHIFGGIIGAQVFSIEQRNDFLRRMNREAEYNEPWHRLMNTEGQIPENFPAQKGQMLVINDALLAELLQFYNLGLQGGQQARRQRLFKFLGV